MGTNLPCFRTYRRTECIVFLKTHEEYGWFSNMAGGYSLLVNGTIVRTSEALYQACRFPHLPHVQANIIGQHSPMAAKMVGKPFRSQSREDWETVRVDVMRWCLRVKLAQNWEQFAPRLLATEDRSIVEQSRRDQFWGAKPIDEDTLVGINALGRLLMELREVLKGPDQESLRSVNPLPISDFLLMGKAIRQVTAPRARNEVSEQAPEPVQRQLF